MVNQKILLPQEIEAFYIIPTLRRYIAFYLKEEGMKQKDIAKILMINTSAISQYTSSKRGNKVDFDEKIKSEIKGSVKRIMDHKTYLKEIQQLLRLIRSSCTLCEIHKELSCLPEDCSPIEMGCNVGKR